MSKRILRLWRAAKELVHAADHSINHWIIELFSNNMPACNAGPSGEEIVMCPPSQLCRGL